jgi:dolichol-phosphate mannosyltransferase
MHLRRHAKVNLLSDEQVLTSSISCFGSQPAWIFGRPIPFIPQERPPEAGNSRWSINKLLKLARHSLTSFTGFPLKLVTWFGIITLLLSIALGLQTLWQKCRGEAVEGFTTVILIQLGVGSVLMISLGLIGEYLARIYDEIKNRPQYIIAEVLEQKEQ